MAPEGRGGITVVWRLTTADDGSSTEVTEHIQITEATVCGGGGQGGCVKSYKRDCFLCQLFISFTSRVLDKMYVKREREAHRLLQQIDTFQLHLFTAQLTLVKKQKTEANSNRKRMKKSLWTKSWLSSRPVYGQYEKLLHELTAEDIPGYRNFLRMNPVITRNYGSILRHYPAYAVK